MLIQRVATALVLLPALLALIWWAPTPWVYAVFSLAGVLMAWEWSALMPLRAPARRNAYAAAMAATLGMIWMLPARQVWLPWLLAASCLWWLVVPMLFAGFPANLNRVGPAPLGALGVLTIASTVLALAWLHAQSDGPLKLLFVFFLVFAADTGAYLAGRNFGRRKLAPTISPGKTIEGAIGGLLLCAAWALTGGVYAFGVIGGQVLALVLLSMLAAAASVVGDLSESMFKRRVGVKDSGQLLPGHGGLLDRVDSVLAAAPVMVLGLMLTGL